AEDGIRDLIVTGVQTCALPIYGFVFREHGLGFRRGVGDAPSPITYTSPKPEAVLAEDKAISAFPLKIKRDNIRIVPVTDLFVKRSEERRVGKERRCAGPCVVYG